MILFLRNSLFLIIAFLCCASVVPTKEDWGFFGHRRINRMAVFTLPEDVFGFYKKHIEFVTEHAVDPDKRRYATKHEAVRHYIDIDHWGEYPYKEVPRNWGDVLLKYTDVYMLNAKGDTIQLLGNDIIEEVDGVLNLTKKRSLRKLKQESVTLSREAYEDFFKEHMRPNFYEDDWVIDTEHFKTFYKDNAGVTVKPKKVFAVDRFSEYGILPYHLLAMQYRLTNAFENKNLEYILRLSADFGHYIGDAHVPLHTTENYNGQFTDQVGIHAFWESRIPELFADKEFDFFVGKARYISDPGDYYWDVVLKSHSYLDSVLLIEKELSITFPKDKQYCYENRLERTIYTQCTEYAKAYSDRLQGMVESQMRDAVYVLGCAWYTAWVDAGKPDLDNLDKFEPNEAFLKELEAEEQLFKEGESKGRKHDG